MVLTSTFVRRFGSAPTIQVGILGCTGVVGQKFIQLLEKHPQLKVERLGASNRSAGKPYKHAAAWKQVTSIPTDVQDKEVTLASPEYFRDCDLVFSALDTAHAVEIENEFAREGIPVFSNASSYRMHEVVPIVIPDVNPEHIDSALNQAEKMNWKKGGFIVTNANCSTTTLTVGIKPLQDAFGIKSLFVTTLQAVSGAGYPGVASLDVVDNLVPYIGGEEPKMEMELLKIFGTYSNGKFEYLNNAKVSAICNRVPVSDGHTECVSIQFQQEGVTPEMVSDVLSNAVSPARKYNLASLPEETLVVLNAPDRPQPKLDRDRGKGFTTTIGGIRKCNLFDVKMTLLGHNTVLGAAGGSILNAELALAKGLLRPFRPLREFSSIPSNLRKFSTFARHQQGINGQNRRFFSTKNNRLAQGEGQPCLLVYKMGGSSLGNPEAIHRACQINYDTYMRGNQLCVVVSALYGVTNMLEKACALAAAGQSAEVAQVRQRLVELHIKTVNQVIGYDRSKKPLVERLESRVDSIMSEFFDPYISKIFQEGIKEGTNWHAAVTSLGERLSVPIVCSVMASHGLRVYEVYTEGLIVTDKAQSQYGGVDGKLTMERLQGALRPLLEEDVIPIISGFIASDKRGELTTLGRGGSDLTATLVASSIHADSVHLWKVEPAKGEHGFMTAWADLSEQYKWMGIRSADPSVVDENIKVDSLSYEEATELTTFGKKVLHSATMAPAMMAQIPIFVRNTAVPSNSGSCIGSLEKNTDKQFNAIAVTAIAYPHFQIIHEDKAEALGYVEVYDAIKDETGNQNIDPKELSIISLVGRNIGRAHDVLVPQISTILGDADIRSVIDIPNHLLLRLGSENSVSVVLKKEEADRASQLLHNFISRHYDHISKIDKEGYDNSGSGHLLWEGDLFGKSAAPVRPKILQQFRGSEIARESKHFYFKGSREEREGYSLYFDSEPTETDINTLYSL